MPPPRTVGVVAGAWATRGCLRWRPGLRAPGAGVAMGRSEGPGAGRAGQLGSWAAGPWRVLEEGAAGLLSWEPTCFCTGKRADGNRRLEQINPVIAARRWPGHRGQRAWAREGP